MRNLTSWKKNYCKSFIFLDNVEAGGLKLWQLILYYYSIQLAFYLYVLKGGKLEMEERVPKTNNSALSDLIFPKYTSCKLPILGYK